MFPWIEPIDNMYVEMDDNNGDTEMNKDAITPLMKNSLNRRDNKCWMRFMEFVRLEGDERVKRWKIMANILFAVGLVINIAMWIWFR